MITPTHWRGILQDLSGARLLKNHTRGMVNITYRGGLGFMRVELLFERLAKNQEFRSLLESTTGLPPGELAESLVREFVQVAGRYKSLSDFAREARQLAEQKIPDGFQAVPDAELAKQIPRRTADVKAPPQPDALRVDPIRIGMPSIDIRSAQQRAEAGAATAYERKKTEHLRKQMETIEGLIQEEIKRDWDTRAGEIRESIVRLKDSHQELQGQIKAIEEQPEPEIEIAAQAPPTVVENPPVGESDTLYLYAVSLHEGEKPATTFLRRLKGIDESNGIVAFDAGPTRIFLSKVRTDRLAVTKAGILLLGKQESIQLRGVHESILNELRASDFVAPFEFGSVVQGREEFMHRIGVGTQRFAELVDQEKTTTTWTVRVMVLDQRVGEVVGTPPPASPQRDRGREIQTAGRRFDIKTLERVLQYERTLAQVVHAALTERATSTNVGLLIGFGSGTTEDWKPALHATYDVAEENQAGFFSTVCDLQDEYKNLGVMLVVSGNAGRFALTDLAVNTVQAISA